MEKGNGTTDGVSDRQLLSALLGTHSTERGNIKRTHDTIKLLTSWSPCMVTSGDSNQKVGNVEKVSNTAMSLEQHRLKLK